MCIRDRIYTQHKRSFVHSMHSCMDFHGKTREVYIYNAIIGDHTYPDGYFHSRNNSFIRKYRAQISTKRTGTSYLAASSFVNSLAAGIAPVLGGLFADFFEASKLWASVSWQSPVSTGDFDALY